MLHGRNAVTMDAFSILWSDLKFYAFSTFSLIGGVVGKVRQE